MHTKIRPFLFASLAAVVLSLTTLQAQTTGSIEGRVRAPDGSVLRGAVIAATGAVPGTRIAEADTAGQYHFAQIPPGVYTLRVTLAGFGAQQRSVIVSLGATTTADFSLSPALSEQTSVIASSPLVDMRSVEGASTVDAQAFTSLPLGRDYTSVASFQPGVTADGAGFSVFGATGLENAFFIDGVDVTGIRTGARNKVVPEEFIQEVQIRTSTYDAEFGGASGGLVNAITRSGGNELKGELFGYFDSESLQSNAKSSVVGSNFAGFTDRDIGINLGGYVVRDRFWFFGVYDQTALRRDVQLLTGSGSPYDGSTFRSQDRKANLYAFKLTLAPSATTSVVGSVIGDPARDAQQLVEDGPPQSRQIHETAGGPSLSIIGTESRAWWVGQLGVFDHRERRNRIPSFTPPFLTTDDTLVPMLDLANCNLPGCYSGAPWVFIPISEPLLRETYERRQERGSFTAYRGSHLLKTGFDVARISGTVRRAIPAGYNRTLSRLADGTMLFTQSWFGDESGSFGPDHVVPEVSGTPRTDNLAFYAQDSWTPMNSVTVDAGVRYERYRLRDAVTGGTIADMTRNFAPRLGAVWDPKGHGDEKVTIAYGRFFQPIPMNHQAGSFRGTSLSVTGVAGFTFNCDQTTIACDSFPNRFAEPADPHLRPPTTDQFSAGYEMKLTESFKVGVRGLYSRLVRAVEDRCDLQGNDAALIFTGNGCVLMNPGLGDYGRGNFPAVTMPDGSSSAILCTNGFNDTEGRASVPCPSLPAAQRKNESVAFTAEQRFSPNSYLMASFLWSRLRGNYDGSFNELGEADPNTNFDFDFPGLLANAYGKLANDRPAQFKLAGFHRLPLGLTVGLNSYFRSGIPEDRLGSFALVSGNPVPLYLSPRGSAGRTPADWDTDLHVDWSLPVRRVRASVIADVFRLFNRQTILRTNPFYNFDGFQSDNVVQTNPDYGVAILRADPRLARVGLRISF
jgi:hypothetical protein